MEQTFDEYVDSWWQQFIKDHKDDSEWNADLMKQLGYEPASDFLDEDETPTDFLAGLTEENDELYSKIFGYCATVEYIDDLPDTESFLIEMFKETASRDLKEYGFVSSFIEDMAVHSTSYDSPLGFFNDLQHDGCQSGMIGMLVYNADCKDLYIKYIDDMEDFKQELDEKIGEPLSNSEHLPHYTWICWICYEETAIRIAQILFPRDF